MCLVLFSPYFAHVLEGWSHRNHPNMLFLFYEELKKVEIVLVISLNNDII